MRYAVAVIVTRNELTEMFLFFSSRLGCLGSLAVSAIVTLILLAVFHVI